MSLWVREGTGGAHLLSTTVRCSPPWDAKRPIREFCMAVHCMCCPPTWLPPLGCSADVLVHTIAPAESRPSDHLPTHWPQQAAVCSTEQTKKPNAQALRPEKDFSKPHLTPSRFPDSLVDDSVFTQHPARFYPTKL